LGKGLNSKRKRRIDGEKKKKVMENEVVRDAQSALEKRSEGGEETQGEKKRGAANTSREFYLKTEIRRWTATRTRPRKRSAIKKKTNGNYEQLKKSRVG